MKPSKAKTKAEIYNLRIMGLGPVNPLKGHSILLEPDKVIIRSNSQTMKIPRKTFKQFAKWYLEEQLPLKKP